MDDNPGPHGSAGVRGPALARLLTASQRLVCCSRIPGLPCSRFCPVSPALLRADWHVHSVFSDGVSTIAENVQAATARGLYHLGCVDHVWRSTAWVPDFVAAVEAARATTALTLSVGVEAKLLDTTGAIDCPPLPPGVDWVYLADHQVPGPDGPRSPQAVRAALARGTLTPAEVIADLLLATERALVQTPRAVLAHLFSVLPKCGLTETMVSDAQLAALCGTGARVGALLEISERWQCPSPRVVRAARAAGMRCVASTDSHDATTVGRYRSVAATWTAAVSP